MSVRLQSAMNCAPFCASGENRMPLLATHADGVPADRRPPAHELRAVELLELLETGAVDDAGDDLAHVEGHAHVHRRDAEQLLGRVERLVGRVDRSRTETRPVQVGHDAPRHADRLGLVPGQVVTEARRLGVHARATELLLVGVLPDGHLDEWRPAEEDAGPALDHDGVVAHAREVGATGGRRPEDDADGGDPLGRELGQAAELLAPGHEDVGLAGQVRPSGLDQEQQREAVLLRHVHGAQELADRRRARRPAADRRVVGDDQALRVRHLDQRHDDTAAHRVAGVQAGERAQLEHRRAGVHESLETLAHQHLAAGPVALHVLGAAAGEDILVQRVHLVDQHAHGGGVVPELLTGDGQARPEGCAHAVVSHEGRRFCRNASIPSAASAPAKSCGRRGRGGGQPLGPRLRGQGPQQLLGRPHRAGSGLPDGGRLVRDPGVERRLVGGDRREEPRRGGLRRAEARTGQRGAGEEAAIDHAQRRHQNHGRRHADPDLGEGEGARLCRHGHVGGSDEAEAARPRVAVDADDDRHRALDACT